MAEAVERAKTLEERVTDMVASTVGELITPEDMRQIVERGIEKALFKERPGPPSHNTWDRKVPLPPLVDELTNTHFKAAMSTAVEQWLKDHSEDLAEMMQKAIDEGAYAAVQRVMTDRMSGLFQHAMGEMQAQGLMIPGQL